MLSVCVTGIRNSEGNINLTLYRASQFVETRDVEIDARTLRAKAEFEKLR
jgi:uncharacterized protein (DUF2141 family)